jgi:hypothetical protein
MRVWLCGLALAVCPVVAQESPEMARAQEEIARLRDLVKAGAVAPLRLEEAEQRMGDARDGEILDRTLYAKLTLAQLTSEQSKDMVAAAERRFERQQKRLEGRRKLITAGVVARGEIAALEEDLEARRLTLELAGMRARLVEELAEMARREEQAALAAENAPGVQVPAMIHFDSDRPFTANDLKAVSIAFEKKFNKPLPISANGDTSAHRALGFDHRGRVDVAVAPDQIEGAWLRTYLESNEIPYYGFRTAIPGKATGAHIHIGPGSTRLRAAD